MLGSVNLLGLGNEVVLLTNYHRSGGVTTNQEEAPNDSCQSLNMSEVRVADVLSGMRVEVNIEESYACEYHCDHWVHKESSVESDHNAHE